MRENLNEDLNSNSNNLDLEERSSRYLFVSRYIIISFFIISRDRFYISIITTIIINKRFNNKYSDVKNFKKNDKDREM